MTLKMILTFSILFQVVAAVLALGLIRVTGRRIAWIVISAAILLMVFRRLFTLGHMVLSPSAVLSDLATEMIALVTSILMAAGIAAIRPIFQAMNQSQKRLRSSEERYRTLAEFASDCIYWIGPGGGLIYISPACRELTGYEPAEFLASATLLDRIIHPEDREAWRHHMHEILPDGGLKPVEFRIVTRQGATRWVSHLCRPIHDRQGRFLGTRGSNRDITPLKKKEAVLDAHARELERSNRELEQFAYVASHDLQGPLRTITNYVQLLARKYGGRLDDHAEKYIAYIVEGTGRMQNLIDDLLIYSRVGRKQDPPRRISLEKVLTDTCRNLEAQIEQNGARITHGPLPECMLEPSQAVQLLQNLVENSLKFRREAAPRIHLSARLEGRWWTVAVKDNGIGIAPEFAGRVFGVFQRLHTRREFPGTGIGLAICKKIVENHGGRIWLESVPGEGTTFYFSLPMDTPDALAPPDEALPQEHGESASLEGRSAYVE